MPQAVAARARALGLTLPDGELDEAALLDLICAPGLLDARRDRPRQRPRRRHVGRQDDGAGAERPPVALHDRPGEGTRFAIELPLTLSIADALIATVGDRTFAVPQSAVREVLEVDPASLRQVEDREIAPFRGGVLPILRLSRLFGLVEHAASRASRLRGRHRARRGRHRGRSHRRTARDRRAQHGRRADHGSMASPARPISATAGSC